MSDEMPNKLMYVSGRYARAKLQSVLGPEWKVLAYGENRTGLGVDVIVFAPITGAAGVLPKDMKSYIEIETHALRPGGERIFLP